MKVRYQKSFLKDLKALQSTPVFSKISKLVFEDILAYEHLEQLSEVKKLKGNDNAYRIRVGNYRLGFFWEDDTIIFSRVLHRSEIYRFFPPT